MIERLVTREVEYSLDNQAAVALLGPRQVGKTTLALEVGEHRNALYLDLETPDDRDRLISPRSFFDAHSDRLVILDEVHRVPDIFNVLRGVIDEGRRIGRGTGRFLVLGSASITLMRQSESLAGRIRYVEMTPVLVSEIENDASSRDRLWLRGGFPASLQATSDRESLIWRRDMILTYLERDIPMFGPRIPAETMGRLWTMLAHLQGSPLNAASLAKNLEISSQSVNRYIDLLVDLLLVRRLRPYAANVGKRLVKSPKVYIRDSGLVHSLLAIESYSDLLGHSVVGMSWEGFVIENLIAALPWPAFPFFYRTSAGAEVDLVIEFPDRSVWAIEIKRSAPTRIDRGFHEARADLKPARSFVVHSGRHRYPISEEIEAIPLNELVAELRALDSF